LIGEEKESQVSAEKNRKIVEQFYMASNTGDMDTELITSTLG
jgi:hypothetical protein